jgi:Xaa-Pro aminopeptidase
VFLEVALRACTRLEVSRAAVPPDFPLALADRLRAAGTELHVARDLFARRRRSKSESELDGIRRAQRAAEAGMAAAAGMLRHAERGDGPLTLAGGPLTCERIKAAIEGAVTESGATIEEAEMIVAHGPQAAAGHHMGSGPIAAGEPVVVDLWPRDRASSCFADMTRTFVAGSPSAELREWRELTLEALDRAVNAIRPGVPASEPYGRACEVYEVAGYPTQRTKPKGTVLEEGFSWGLGHGVGLEVHEPPFLGRAGADELSEGDVLAIEPGLARLGDGSYRVEDLVLVTAGGPEVLTGFHYELAP